MTVLDASALLAYLHDEPGAEAVEEALSGPTWIGAVNLSEVLSKLADAGEDPDEVRLGIGIIGIEVTPFDEDLAVETARLRPLTARACLALGRTRRQPVLTADTAWQGLVADVDIRVIR